MPAKADPNSRKSVRCGERDQTVKHVTLQFTLEELRLLTALAADQLFRKEFIDPRYPGHKSNIEEIRLGKSLVGRLRVALDKELSPGAAADLSNGQK